MATQKRDLLIDDTFYAPGGFAERLKNMSDDELKAYGEELRRRREEAKKTED